MNLHLIYKWIKLLPIVLNLYVLILIVSFLIFGYYEEYSYIFFGHSMVFIDIPLFLSSWNPKRKLTNKIFGNILPRLPFCKWHRFLSLNLIFILFSEYMINRFDFSKLECHFINTIFITTSASLLYTLIWKIRHDYKKSRPK